MNALLVTRLLCGLFLMLAAFLLLPTIVAAATGESTLFIFATLVVSLAAISSAVLYLTRKRKTDLTNRSAFFAVTLSWVMACLVGSLPYYFSGALPDVVNAVFESASGFTGTGATVVTDIEALPKSLLLWRCMTQWLGGMGIVVFFLALLPLFGIGGGQLFKAEISGPQKDKITPRVRETAKKLWMLYLSLTLILCGLLTLAGMNLFDAFCHAMTTVATGGFSTKAAGIAHFDSALIEWLIIVFMLIGSINFALHFRLLLNRDRQALFNTELKWFTAIIVSVSIIMAFTLWEPDYYPSIHDAIRKALFTVVCTISSTGYTNANYTLWGHELQFLLILLMIMGGMSGSTAGGMKCIRLVAAFKQLSKELIRVLHPSAILRVKADDHSIPEGTINAIWGFIFIYFLIFSLMTALFTFQGLDLISASTAVVSALSNIGPALGELGPYDSFVNLTDVSKITFIGGMILGRLEFYTVIILFTPYFWKK